MKMKARAAVDALLERLDDEDISMRAPAAWALGEIGHPSAVARLIEMLDARQPHVRRSGAEALRSIGDERGLEAVEVAEL